MTEKRDFSIAGARNAAQNDGERWVIAKTYAREDLTGNIIPFFSKNFTLSFRRKYSKLLSRRRKAPV